MTPPRAPDGPLIVTARLDTTFGRMAGGRWIEEPTATFTCLLCQTTEGPVEGARAVRAFGATIRRAHAVECPAQNREAA